MSSTSIVRAEELEQLLHEPTPRRDDEEKTGFYYLEVLWRRKFFFLAVLLVSLALGVLAYSTRKKIYQSTALLLVVSKASSSSESGRAGDLVNQVGQLTGAASVDTQVEVIQSPDLLADAFSRVPGPVRAAGFAQPEDSKAVPTWALKVESDKDTDVIAIAATSYSPEASASFANSVAQSYLDRDRERGSQAAKQARKFVESQLKQSGQDYIRSTLALADFQRQSGLVDADTQLQDASNKIADLQSSIEKAEADREVAQKSADVLEDELRKQKINVDFQKTVAQNPQYTQTLQDLTSATDALHRDEKEYLPNSVRIEDDKRHVAAVETSLAGIAKNYVSNSETERNPNVDIVSHDLIGQKAQAQSLAKAIASDSAALSRHLKDLQRYPGAQQHLAELQQQVDVHNRIYNALSDKYYDLVVAEKSVLPNGFIISVAAPPVKPSSPNPATFAGLFSFVGIVFGIVAAFIAEHRDKRIRDPNYIESNFGILTLTAVPRVAQLSADSKFALMGNVKKNPAFVEAYRYLRNNIILSMGENAAHVLAITSPGAGDGKTTTSINLAISLGMDGKRVILVDGDLRRPTLAEWNGSSGSAGFTDVVDGKIALEAAVLQTKYPNVSLLPSGKIPERPTELLNSQASRDLIRKLGSEYEYVIIDCPPAAGLSDMQIIASIADGVLLVVALDKTTSPYVNMTIRMLRQVGARIIGTIVNQVGTKHAAEAPYYYIEYGDASKKALGSGK